MQFIHTIGSKADAARSSGRSLTATLPTTSGRGGGGGGGKGTEVDQVGGDADVDGSAAAEAEPALPAKHATENGAGRHRMLTAPRDPPQLA